MRFIVSTLDIVTNGIFSIISALAIAVVGTLFAIAVFNPPPSGPPTANNISWAEDATIAQKGLASVGVAWADWEVRNMKVVALAEGTVPFTDEKVRMIGFGGKWYLAETNDATYESGLSEYSE